MAVRSRKKATHAGNQAKTTRKKAAPKPKVATFSDRTFDARPDRLDLRDRAYRPPLRSLPPHFPDDASIRASLSGYVRTNLILDQGTEGACTGFGLACVVNYLMWIRHRQSKSRARFHPVSPRMLYEMAKRYDEWPGQNYEGSSCRGALKGWHKHGVCSEAKWPYPLDKNGEPVFVRPNRDWNTDATKRTLGVYYRIDRKSVVDLQAAIADIGAVYVSAFVHDGWDTLLHSRNTRVAQSHKSLPTIPAPKNPKDLGGHAFAIVGYNEQGFVVQNSWGKLWGAAGFGVLPYDDWIEHATDAWACALGVPVLLPDAKGTMRQIKASRWPVASGRSLASIDRAARNPANPPDDPWPIDHRFDCTDYQPWSTDAAYSHTLVSGNDGRLIVSDGTRASSDFDGFAEEVVVTQPLAWLKESGEQTLKLALYAHGGLNSECKSIERVRVLGPYFQANGIYPLFFTWKTGAGETLMDMIQDWARKIPGFGAERSAGLLDVLRGTSDRAIEAVGHVLGKGIWSEMRENAALGTNDNHGLDLLARKLATLSLAVAKNGKQLEVHLLGHSAGSILLGHLLDELREPKLVGSAPTINSFTLFAAACSTRFAVDHYLPAAHDAVIDLERMWLYYLTDENEKKDGLPSIQVPVYGKSLLYLVSRALDDKRKMPLLGMARSLDRRYASDADQWAKGELATIKEWQSNWKPGVGDAARGIAIGTPTVRNTRANGQIQATHGSFDNNIDVLTASLERIRGRQLIAPMEWLDY